MYDTQQSTALPDRPALQNWWILICHYMKMCHGRNKWKRKNTKRSREEMEQKWPSNLSEEVQRGERMFLKMPDLLMPCTYILTSTSARRITSLSENALCGHAKKMNLRHCFFLSCPFSFPIVSDTQQSLKGKKRGFPISASEDTLGSWTWVHCSVEQGMSCCKWRPKSILQAELLTTHIPKNLTVHKREEGWNKERSRED